MSAGPEQIAAIRCYGVAKHYQAIQALYPTDLQIRRETIHALVGQNGAGKSTVLGIMAGRIKPSAGTVEIYGKAEELGRPRAARSAGVIAIYQELTTIPELSALENVF